MGLFKHNPIGSPAPPLFTRAFLALNLITFLSFANIAIFFHFEEYLALLPIDPRWFGFLMGVFSLAVIVVRPLISPFLNDGNGKRWLVLSTGVNSLGIWKWWM